MGFCPNCQKEYGLSVTICPECNALLKEEAASAKVPMFSLQKEEAAIGFVEYAKSSGVDCAYEFSSRENAYRIFVSQKEQKRGPKLFAEYCLMESRKKRAAELENAPVQEEVITEPEAPVEPTPAPSMYIGPISRPSASSEPVSSSKPSYDALEAVLEETKLDDPVIEDSVIDDSISDEPVIDEPIIDEPVIEEPVIEEVILKKEPVKPSTKPSSFKNSFFDDEFGNFSAPKKEEDTKHKDILNLFMNPAQPAPKRDRYSTVTSSDEPDSRFTVAPGEDPLSSFSTDPFYGKRTKLVTPVSSPISDYNVDTEVSVTETSDEELVTDSYESSTLSDTYEETSVDSYDTPSYESTYDAVMDDNIDVSAYDSYTDSAVSYESNDSYDVNDSLKSDYSYSSNEGYTSSDSYTSDYTTESYTADSIKSSESSFETAYTEPASSASEPASSEPIFVEVKPIADEELDAGNIVDAVDVVTIDKEEANDAEDDAEDDAYSAFLSQFREASLKKSQKQSEPAPSVEPAASDASENSGEDVLDSYLKDSESLEASLKNSVVDEILPDKEKYEGLDEYSYISNDSGRPKDIQDTKISVSADSSIIEEVIDNNVEIGKAAKDAPSSVANPNVSGDNLTKSQPKKTANFKSNDFSDLDEYKGFVPDYSYQEKPQDVEETPEEAAYRQFTEKVQERKRANELAESQKQKEQTRKANLEFSIDKKGNKIVFEDNDDLDSYAGFVPDYKPNTSNEDEFDFYKPHTVSSYSKYKKGKKDILDGSTVVVTHMRATSNDEVKSVFVDKVPSNIKNVIDPSLIRTTGFLLSISGKQLATLFNSWLMLNMTASYVKQFEKPEATNEENDENKINGMKKVLKTTFGDLNESFLDYIVRRYYSKYLDD